MIFNKESDFEEALIKILSEKGWEKEVLKNCILRSPADTDAFQSGRCAEHNGRPETLAIIN